jgi:peptidoglycan hydrolase CwlO-like protein
MIYWIYAFIIVVMGGCVSAVAEKDTETKDKKVLVKSDDFTAIIERAKKNQEMAFHVGKKADGAVVSKVEAVAQKINTLESTIEKLEEKNEKLQDQIKSNPSLDIPFFMDPIIDSTNISKEKDN